MTSNGSLTGPDLAPARAASHKEQSSVDELVSTLDRTPLFMSSLDEKNSAGNAQLDALRALAYEGTPFEIADNFREQGNDCHKAKKWADAVEFYSKGLEALKVRHGPDQKDSGSGVDGKEESDPEKEKKLEETLLLNRAASNLELRNHGRVVTDTAAVLSRTPTSQKATYRLALAHLALSRPTPALSALDEALNHAPSAAPLLALRSRAQAQLAAQTEKASAAAARVAALQAEARALATALARRGIETRTTGGGGASGAPDLEDAVMHLASPLDPGSTLFLPVLLLYPLAAQSDLVKAVAANTALQAQLDAVLPPPWDAAGPPEYTAAGVACYMETAAGGLVRVGKKIALGRALAGGRVPVRDGLARVLVVPRGRADAWTTEFRRRAGKG